MSPKPIKPRRFRLVVEAPAISAQHSEDVERMVIRVAYTDDRRKTLYSGEHDVTPGQRVTVFVDAEVGREVELSAWCRPRAGHPQANDSRPLRALYVVGEGKPGAPDKVAPGQYVLPHPSAFMAEIPGFPETDPVGPTERPEPETPTEITPDMEDGGAD